MADIEFDKKNIWISPSNVLDLSINMSNVGVPWGINGPTQVWPNYSGPSRGDGVELAN